MTIAVSKLAAAQAAAKAAPAAPAIESRLARAREASPRGELVTLPVLGQVWIELAGGIVVDEIEGAVFSAMAELKLDPTPFNSPTYASRRTALTLAWAVRDATNHGERFDSPENWCQLDIDLLSACGLVYGDVRERLNPVGMPALDRDQLDAIRLGIEKKNPMLLRSVGVVALSLYLLSTADPPASSPTPPSSTGA